VKAAAVMLIVLGIEIAACAAVAKGVPVEDVAIFLGGVVMLPAGITMLVSSALRGKDFV
jgi:hypothetical protein